jgi:Ca-activated chloride channel homolog
VGRIRYLALNAVASLALLPLAAEAQDRTFTVDVRLVRLLAAVQDDHGKPAADLKQEDFTVYDNGFKQDVSVFERYTELPLSVALLVDISGSTAKDLKYEGDSVSRFLKALFREGNTLDSCALFSFNWEVRLRTSFTRNMQRLEHEMRLLRAEAGTAMYDAIWLGAQELEDREGRKVMVIVTDGGDTYSIKKFDDAQRALHRSDTILYSVVVMPITNDAGRNIGGENALQTLSANTGGRIFYPSVGTTLDQTFDEILRDLRTQYLLGYYPHTPPAAERFHRVEVKVNRPGLRVLTRNGYYGESAAAETPAGTGKRGPRSTR